MNSASGPEISKAEIRAHAFQRRRNLVDKDRLSLAVCERFCALPQFMDAATVLVYIHVRDEVRTGDLVTQLLQAHKKVVVPFCVGDALSLFHFSDPSDLSVGTFGILEPREALRTVDEKLVAPEKLDVLAVPGVAFDRWGGRVGHGRGYFDRLLPRLRSDAYSVGLAFECQLFDRVRMDSHDVHLHAIVTEKAVYTAGKACR